MITAYGNFEARLPNGLKYQFSPSLENISKLGSSEEIINVFSRVFCIPAAEWVKSIGHNSTYFDKVKKHAGHDSLRASILVLQCCCDGDVTAMVGGWKYSRGKLIYQPAFESPQTIITLAEHLLRHGVTGTSKKKRKQSQTKKTAEFNPSEYANTARVHLNMTRDEAWSLTVSEFVDLMDAKFPDVDENGNERYFINREEYDRKMKQAKELRDRVGVH
tara:strand:- start:2891 stop:3544 length:654 start_codon:yes stop_codon:yes gene_type:complete